MSSILDWIGRKVEDLVALGYPESVAKRISSGELPMDEASRMARAAQQGYSPEIYYHSGSPNINILDTAISSDKKTADTGTWFTGSPEVANTYLPPEGAMYPVRMKTGDYDKVDAGGQTWNWIENPEKTKVVSTDDLARAARTKAGSKGLIIDNVVDMGTNYQALNNAVDDKIDWILKYQDGGARNIAVNDPSTVKSVNAAYDPKYKGPNIMGALSGLTAGGLGLGAALQSEDAEASPFGDAMSTGQRMLQLGMIAPSTLDNPSALKSAVTKYTNYLKGSKAFREREYRAAESAKLLDFSQTDLGGRIVADLEKMIGKPIMPIRGDRSDLGTLNSVNGIEVNTPVEAGSKFSQAHNADDRGWMSTYGVAVGVQNKIMKIADDLGVEPIAVYNAMGRDSINFSTPIAEAMFKQLDELPIAKKDIKAFDADMRKRYKDWVGLESESALDQLLGRGEFNMDGAGKMRTVFSTLMGMDKYQKRGFPSYDKIVDGLTDPALANVEKGDSGLSMYQTIANPVLRELGIHQSYDGVMPGNYIGGLPDDMSVPFEVMFPEIFKNTSKMVDKHGRPLSRDLQINTANMSSDGWQIADEAWFDGVQKYLKENPKSVGTGSVILGALSGNAMAGAEVPDYAAPMAVQAAGQSDLTGVANPGRDFGNIAAGIDMLLPLFAESLKPATMGNAELTEEQRKRGYYYGM